MKYKNLFTPVQIGRVTLKNRFALAPMGPLGLADARADSTREVLIITQSGQRAAPA